jgi:hypothetical protein
MQYAGLSAGWDTEFIPEPLQLASGFTLGGQLLIRL